MPRHETSSSQLSLLFITFGLLFAFTNAHTFKAHQRPGFSRWVQGARVDGNRTLSMHIHIAAPKSVVAAAAQELYNISDPASENYGNHWSAAQVASHFAPTSDTLHNVLAWLDEAGIPQSSLKVSRGRSHISFSPKVRDAELLLHTRYYEFHHTDQPGHGPQLAVQNYTIPSSVMDSISFIEPTFPTTFGQTKKPRSTQVHLQHERGLTANWNGTRVNCLKYITPECLRLLYNIPFKGTEPLTNSSLGIFEVSAQTWFPNDLDSFFSRFEPQLVGSRPSVRSIDGGYMQSNWTGFPFNSEPSLDIEYALALTDGRQPVVELLVGNTSTTTPLSNMLAALDASYCDSQTDGGHDGIIECGGASAPPSVISISYGMNEADYPAGYLEQQCLEFLKLGLQGISVVAGSGDWGVADQQSQCIDPSTGLPADYPGSGNGSSPWHFSSMFPASCPWVTAVGGTSLAPAPLSNATQPTWNQSSPSFPPQRAYLVAGDDGGDRGDSTSGGGFSNLFAAPDYQTRHVASYLASQRSHVAPFANSFRAGGRGYPDVALLAQSYLVVYDGGLYTIDGTSAATPLFAAMLARINNERQSRGKKTVGFVNPVLYKHRGIFDDVAEGANEGCGVGEAFRAAQGWDAVTGLGAPDFGKLSEVFMRLP